MKLRTTQHLNQGGIKKKSLAPESFQLRMTNQKTVYFTTQSQTCNVGTIANAISIGFIAEGDFSNVDPAYS
jgi:hypothetical protein